MTDTIRLATALGDRYRIESQLGAGGMATVYLATDLKHDRQVALKVLRPELGHVLGDDRFLTEIKISARLDHPHILTLIDSGASGGFLYYVLPLVRGESLRDKLNREKQLSLEEAVTITRQVASALDYAHRQGVVHRDIKPENILLQEGEAMLADFGIALAVKEAGGNRLTETGLSLGTPQYMSPEQATGDRQLDARSDLYSLAAVLYEMLAGEPPVTGPNAQAMIAKLMTERPVHLRVVRASVPAAIDAAVAKALDKTPADRFATAGEFARALDLTPTVPIPSVSAPKGKPATLIAAAAIVVVLAVAAVFGLRGRGRPVTSRIDLRDRTQVTFSGNVAGPVLSEDGKQIAFGVKSCTDTGCNWAIEIQDVGATSSRRIIEGASAAYSLAWSPDRRYLIAQITLDHRFGSYLVSILGGAPRFLTAGVASFYAGGDSLLIGPTNPGPNFVVRVAGLNGAVVDSVIVPGPGGQLSTLVDLPGSSHFVALVVQGGQGLWQVMDRTGTVIDKLLNSCTCGGTASHDALWMQRAGPTASEAVVRVAFDPTTGKLAAQQDTAYNGAFTGLSVTGDGSHMLVDDGSSSFATLVGSLPDMLKGKFPAAPLLAASSPVGAVVSPDGNRLLIRRTIPAASGLTEIRMSVAPFSGGSESPVPFSGRLRNVSWADSVTLDLVTMDRGQTHLMRMDVRSGQVSNRMDLPDSVVYVASSLSNGWVWLPSTYDRMMVSQGGKEHSIARPDWLIGLEDVEVSPDEKQLAFMGYGASQDSIRWDVVPIEGGTPVPWVTTFAESGAGRWLPDGSLLAMTWSGQETVSLMKLTGAGRVQNLGIVPHAVSRMSFSLDLKKASIGWTERHFDAWLYRVVKQ